MSADPEQKEKAAFAAFLLKEPNEPFKAGLAVFPDDTRKALWVATHWLADPVVLAETKRLKAVGADLDGLPTKADLARTVWELTQMGPLEDRIKASKLYADIRGFIEKPQAQVAVNVNNNRVMVIRDQGSDADWESKVAKQQANLLNAAATRH